MRFRALVATVAGLAMAIFSVSTALANVNLVQISSDSFTNSSSQHRTEVEPDTFTFGSTIVAAVQSGRFFNGGASDIGWATSQDGGQSWTHGFLPGMTMCSTPANTTHDRVSDLSVASYAERNVWLIASIRLLPSLPVPPVFLGRSGG